MIEQPETSSAGSFIAPEIPIPLDAVEHVGFDEALARLAVDFPDVTVGQIEYIMMREWEAFTGGRPTAVPSAVEAGAREVLDERP